MRHPERWLAVLRIAVGVWFAKAIFTKLSVTLAWGFLPVPTASDRWLDRKSTRLNSSHSQISYAVFCLKKKKKTLVIAITSLQLVQPALTTINRHHRHAS